MQRTTVLRLLAAAALLACLPIGRMVAAERSIAAMTTAARAFLESLTPEQRQKATYAVSAEERLRWHFIPNEMFPRNGVAFRTMTEAQRARAHDLLKAGLSQRGYMTASAIMDLENVLRAIESGGRFARDPVDYQFTVFGTPGSAEAWGWRVEGHHLSLHFTIAGGTAVATSPTFTGSNPAEVREGPKAGLRVLAPLEDLGRALVSSLDDRQRATAVLDAVAPGDILTMNRNDISPLTPPGLTASAMTGDQRQALMRLIEAYTSMVADDLAAERLAKIEAAGTGAIAFGWAGPTVKGAKHYYRVQGPTFLIEYDNTQNDGNHIHAVWRDFNGDFGRDLLREHLREYAH
ncbi:MAG: DUF3500 domain-containing protein [Vicinamibacterales bacterium]